jgi:hypothetical protein
MKRLLIIFTALFILGLVGACQAQPAVIEK